MSKRLDLLGKVFGKLTIIEDCGNNRQGQSMWRGICDCGNITAPILGGHLTSGHTNSCGCYMKQRTSESVKKENIFVEQKFGTSYGYLLNKNDFFIVDTEYVDKIKVYGWYFDGYYVSANNLLKNNKKIRLHRLVYSLYSGKDIKDIGIIDHINRNRLDNRTCNFRIVSNFENAYNKNPLKNNTSGYMGVALRKDTNKYYAKIKVGQKSINLGNFDNIEDALITRLKAEKEYFGDFAPQRDLFKKYNI